MRAAWRKREREKKRGQSDQASPNKKDNQMRSILCTTNTITSLNASNLVGEKEREREAMGSRAVEGWDGWGQWQLSTAETRSDWRSDRPVVLDVPSAAIFSLRRARAAQ